MTLGRRRLVRVPASTANLGPGFDVMAAALTLHLDLEVVETGTFAVETPLDVPRDRTNLVVRAFERLHPADGITFRIESTIPTSGGLGSSAAAIVAGLMAADHMFELDADLLTLATELDGHPDNVAAAIEGGFVISAAGRTWRIDVPMGLEAVLVVPSSAVGTAEARAALPELVPRADAVFNVGAASLLTLGLATGNWEAVSGALHDRLHQPYRAHLYPQSAELLERAMGLGALGATMSGAGPTVLVWSHFDQTGGLVERLRREAAEWARVMRVPFESQGADVRSL
ncbi:MAG: homoserine kinase [Solirubrobacteraceae bacterium]|jgi:homoserine kinase|nr:homoserine kinase [Solirubrobacteraceae bacterium]